MKMSMTKIATVSIAASAVLCLAGSELWAATVEVVYTGNVTSGIDTSGLFGAVGANLAGDTFTATYLFDPSLGFPSANAAEGYNSVAGELPYNGLPSPSLGASITINGQTLNVSGSDRGAFGAQNSGSSSFEYSYAATGSTVLLNDLMVADASLPASLTMPFTYALPSGEESVNSLTFLLASGETIGLGDQTVALSTTPLPDSLPLFAAGLGVMGLLVWRKKREPAAAFAA